MSVQVNQEEQANTERRGKSLGDLHTLLESRTETLALLQQLADMRPFKAEESVQLALQEFCEALVDYTASAHFQLYRFFEEGKERRKAVLEVANRIYPRIATTTTRILDFNDEYDCEDHCSNLANLAEDLSRLGEVLADRIQMEDQLIQALQSSGRGK